MNVLQRISQGWHAGIRGLEIIRDHPKLLIYPIANGLAVISLMSAFMMLAVFVDFSWDDWDNLHIEFGSTLDWFGLFIISFATTFITVFMQVALVFNIDRLFSGLDIDIMAGWEHSADRIRKIALWAAFTSTVGVVLRALQTHLGQFGRSLSGMLGLAWSWGIYFVVPVLALEDHGPVESARRSAEIIRAKWGSSIGAGVSFSAFYLLGTMGSCMSASILWRTVHPALGVLFGFVSFMLLIAVVSAARSVFQTAAYRHTLGDTPYDFDEDLLDDLFRKK